MPRNPPHLSRSHSSLRCGRSRRAGSISWSKPANDPGVPPGGDNSSAQERSIPSGPTSKKLSIDSRHGGNLRSAQDIVEALELGTVHRWRTLAVHGWRASDAERLKSLGPAGQDQSKAPSFGLFVGDLQPLPFPGALDPSVADRPTRLVQQSCNLAIAVAAIVAGQRNDVGHQPFAILTALGNVGRTLMWSAATTKDFATI
jgi:hypothetical protein